MTATKDFFKKPTPESITKIEIVTKYFDAWARVFRNSKTLAYVDLFAGPGRYDDGTESVPMRILKVAAGKNLQHKFIAIFNDVEYRDELERNLHILPVFNTFSHKPKFFNTEINHDRISVSKIYKETIGSPTLFFIDPWGYKGLSLDLVASTVQGFGCDCLFFFNYARINHALEVEGFTENMDVIFGKARSANLKQAIKGRPPSDREKIIIQEVTDILKSCGAGYVHPFAFFFSDRRTTTSHYLFHLSKNPLANKIIKRITSKLSTAEAQGVAKFRFGRNEAPQFELFDLPADELQESLSTLYRGTHLTVAAIISDHPRRTALQYTDKNYRDVLRAMEQAKMVKMDRAAHERRPGTLADSVVVYFPKKGHNLE